MLSERSHLQLTTAVFLTLSFIFQRLEIKARPENEVKRTTVLADASSTGHLKIHVSCMNYYKSIILWVLIDAWLFNIFVGGFYVFLMSYTVLFSPF